MSARDPKWTHRAGVGLASLGALVLFVALAYYAMCSEVTDGFTSHRLERVGETVELVTVFEWEDFRSVAGVSGAMGLFGIGLVVLGARMSRRPENERAAA